MQGFRTALRQLFSSRLGLLGIARNSFVFFGVCSAVVQLLTSVLVPRDTIPNAAILLTGVGLGALVYGVVRSWPRSSISKSLVRPDTIVEVRFVDIFDYDAAAVTVIGFTDTFDTDVSRDIVIDHSSVQGQFVVRRYGGDPAALDVDLDAALNGIAPTSIIDRLSKALGKLTRYPLGTVAVVIRQSHTYLCVAYSRMGEDLVARASVGSIWRALDATWDTVERVGGLRPVTLPIIGSGLGRIGNLDREGLLKLILMSFAARSRSGPITTHLTIAVAPSDREKVNMLEISAFLHGL